MWHCNGEDATDAIEMTIKTELKADYVNAEVRRLAMNDRRFGVHVSIDDFYMVSRQDRIADYAQNGDAEQLAFRPLLDDEEAKSNLKAMAEGCIGNRGKVRGPRGSPSTPLHHQRPNQSG